MNPIYKKICDLCILHSITVNALELNINVNRGTIKKWKFKENLMPSSAILVLIADYFDVSVDYLLGRTTNPKSHIESSDFSQTACHIHDALSKIGSAASEAEIELKRFLKVEDISTN